MKKHILFASALASLFTLGACDYNEENFPGFDEYENIVDVRVDTLNFVASDYAAIANIKSNKELALSKDPEGKTYEEALKAMGKQHFFTEMITPEEFVPAYLSQLFPYASDNSKMLVNYNLAKDLPAYLAKLNAANTYQLSEADYETVWGDKVKASFLSPSTVDQIPFLLSKGVKNPARGDVAFVKYAYSQTEPSIGGGNEGQAPQVAYTKIADVITKKSGNFTVQGQIIGASATSILINDGTASIRVLRNHLSAFALGDVVEVKGDVEERQALTRFKSKSTVKFLKRNDKFEYAAPKAIDNAYFETYVTKPSVEYVSYEGTLTKSGKNYNIEIGNEAIKPGLTNALFVDESLLNQKVTVTGYLTGVSGSTTKYPNTFATSVVAAGTKSDMTSIGLLQYKPAAAYKVHGVVTALYTRGFMVADETGSILVYENKEPQVVIGDLVQVEGTTSQRNDIMQFGKDGLKITTLSTQPTPIPTEMVPQEMTAADFDALASTPRLAYATFTGKLEIKPSKNGYNFYNVTVNGAKTSVSLQYVDESKFDATLNGKNVVVTGYVLDYKNGRANVMYTKVEAAPAAAALATRARIEPTNYAAFEYTGSEWKEYEKSATGTLAQVMQPADYEPTGHSSLSNPNDVLPIYLKTACPYVKEGDKRVVIYLYYSNSNTTVAADEYEFDGTVWNKTVNYAPAQKTFVLTAGSWIALKEYFANTFAGELRSDMTIVDVLLNKKDRGVWSAGAAYSAIQASGYAGSSNGNQDTESWLITPQIDLTDGETPKAIYESNVQYINGNNYSDFMKVMVSTNYVPAQDGDKEAMKAAVKAAEWKELKFDVYPTDRSFVKMTTDMSQFNGQKVYMAFKYTSTTKCAPTIKVQNFVVQEVKE